MQLGVEDDHNVKTNLTKLEGVKFQITDVIQKYEARLSIPIKAKGSYQDTKDGGVRFKLEVQDPETNQWLKIFDHVDYGDDNHDIENYRGASAYCSAIRTDGHAEGFVRNGESTDDVAEIFESLEHAPLTQQPTVDQAPRLPKIGYGSIKVDEIEPDNMI